ncbi:phosphatase PAP2 family protein [Paenibacillus sp. 1P07SE]|uniref:phosphatase PAP2 family protein n=1 Tax=Paenibacillus sp. 1P07SE TaxID=3132209 RepID=UPI0039A6E047
MPKRVMPYPLLLLLVIPLMGLLYVWINREPGQLHLLVTDLDSKIPMIKAFIVPYMIWMPFLYLTLIYFYYRDKRLYYETLIAYTVSVLICYGVYMVFQTTVPRAELAGDDLLSRMVKFVYANDQPFNCFPSIHCLTSYLLFHAASRSRAVSRRVLLGIGLLSWTIIVSTVFVKQHVVLDVFAGIMLAHVVLTGVQKWMGSRVRLDRSDRRQLPAGMS